MKNPFSILIVALGFMVVSCESTGLDLEGNWIKLTLYEDSRFNEGVILKSDTLNRNFGDEIIIRIHSQAQPGYELVFSVRINNDIVEDLTYFAIGPSLRAYYEENGVERKIHDLKIFLGKPVLNSGDELKLMVEIKSISDVKVEREIVLEIN